jgi:hypothetical protein
MNARTVAKLLGVVCMALVPAPLAGQCLGSSVLSTRVQQLLTPVLQGSDSASIHLRHAYNLVQVENPQGIAYVSDSALCHTAALALGALQEPVRDYSRGVWVLKAGPTRFIVFDGTQWGAGSRHLIVFDSTFEVIGSIPL